LLIIFLHFPLETGSVIFCGNRLIEEISIPLLIRSNGNGKLIPAINIKAASQLTLSAEGILIDIK
jgi:hypothetical protein